MSGESIENITTSGNTFSPTLVNSFHCHMQNLVDAV